MSDLKWIPIWERDAPEEEDVAVKVQHHDGSFGLDIGKRHFSTGWNLQFFNKAKPVAWSPLPKP